MDMIEVKFQYSSFNVRAGNPQLNWMFMKANGYFEQINNSLDVRFIPNTQIDCHILI